jgi:DNA segregation ATPase FtsK/SpoIIIE, S-DNA-T family
MVNGYIQFAQFYKKPWKPKGLYKHCNIMSTSENPLITWPLPQIDMLVEEDELNAAPDASERQQASIIEKTLAEFNVHTRVVEILHGPATTWFGIQQVGPGGSFGGAVTNVKTKDLKDLFVDIATTLGSPYIQVEGPLPGRNYAAIGVPNDKILPVSIKNVMESEAFARLGGSLRLAIGVDMYGNPICFDLERFPHLLISGTTNSGKSVCVHALLACLLLSNTPDDLRLILMDYKRVELSRYNGIPHLLSPVIVEMDRSIGALQWVLREMDQRYNMFAQAGVRNIQSYNTRLKLKRTKGLPYIVVIIDEIAELMTFGGEINERAIARLGEMGHTAGIHLILTTTRPSTDVLSDYAKTKFPARIAFRVVSTKESRMIINQPGAEKLAGNGDMLMLTPNLPKPVHLQGVNVREHELANIVYFWRAVIGWNDKS